MIEGTDRQHEIIPELWDAVEQGYGNDASSTPKIRRQERDRADELGERYRRGLTGSVTSAAGAVALCPPQVTQ